MMAFEIIANVLGDPSEGTTSLELRVEIIDGAGRNLDLQWNLNGDADPDDLPTDPRIIATNDEVWSITMPSSSPDWNWEKMISLNIADTHDPDNPGAGSRTYPIVARVLDVEDSNNEVASDDASISVSNTLPIFVGAVNAAQTGGGGCSGGPVTVSGSFKEFGVNDEVTVRVNWGDSSPADTSVVIANNETKAFSFEHTYAAAGNYHITWEVWDDEGTEFNIDPQGAGFADLAVAGGGGGGPSVCLNGSVLTVTGSGGNDSVTISQPNGNVRVESSFFATTEFPAASVQNMVVHLGAGDDVLVVTANKPLVAVGGDGMDILTGGPGRSILIGGNGSDLLYGGGSQDILVDGRTTYDDLDVALLAMLTEWSDPTTSAVVRMNNLIDGSGGPRANGNYFLAPAGNDLAIDILIGGGGTDWILRHSGDLNLGLFDIVTTS